MRSNIRVIFFVLISMFFSLNLAHGDMQNIKKNKNHLFKFHSFSKKKNLKNNKLSNAINCQVQPSREFKKAWKNSNNKNSHLEMPVEILSSHLDCDYICTDMEVENKILHSDYGRKVIWHTQNILDNLKNLYLDTVDGLDCEIDLTLDYFFPYYYPDINLAQSFEDFERLFLIQNYLSKNDIQSAENTVMKMQTNWFKNSALEGIFNEYLIKNQINDASRIYSMLDFDLYDEDEEDEEEISDITDRLIIGYLRNNDFQKAINLALTVSDEFYRSYDLKLIVKYYSRIGDIENAKRVIEMIPNYESIRDAKLFIVDYYAREKKIKEFQKFVFSSEDEEFKKAANFILNIYQNNFDVALNNMPYKSSIIIYNLAEILISLNRIPEAEDIINCFGDDWDIEDTQLFFINAYLKNGQVDEAKRVRDEMPDPYEKIVASKLIQAY